MDFEDVSKTNIFGPEMYDEEYFYKGGLKYKDKDGKTHYSGYLGKSWDGGYHILTEAYQKIFGNPTILVEIGCDMGSFIDFCIRNCYGKNLFGYDFSEYAINHPVGKAKGHIFKGDVCEGLNHAHKSDLTIATDLMEHIYYSDLPNALREIHRVSGKYIFFLIALSDSKHNKVNSYRLEKGLTPDFLGIKDENTLFHISKGHVNMQNRAWWLQTIKNITDWKHRHDLEDRFSSIIGNKLGTGWLKEFVFIYEVD